MINVINFKQKEKNVFVSRVTAHPDGSNEKKKNKNQHADKNTMYYTIIIEYLVLTDSIDIIKL